MFRAPTQGGIINRMGFNNPGVHAMIQQLKYWRDADLWPSVPVGLNLGKSKITPLEEAPEEYGQLVETCWPWADFLVLNISSPNTPELRQLQGSNALDGVLRAVQQAATRAAASHPDCRAPSLWVKVDPDLSSQALDELLETCLDHNLFGIVATNTTTRRPRSTIHTEEEAVFHETGGLSGKPLRDRSTEVIQHIYRQCGKKLTIMGVGGIFSAKDAWEKVGSGASLLQIYSALVYKGPSLVKEVVDGLRHQLSLHGLASLNQGVGSQLPYLSD
jgi:dihydroorotate dehydrogenase